MARKTKAKRKDEDSDFKIFVDQSCLSAPMDDEPVKTPAADEREDQVLLDAQHEDAADEVSAELDNMEESGAESEKEASVHDDSVDTPESDSPVDNMDGDQADQSPTQVEEALHDEEVLLDEPAQEQELGEEDNADPEIEAQASLHEDVEPDTTETQHAEEPAQVEADDATVDQAEQVVAEPLSSTEEHEAHPTTDVHIDLPTVDSIEQHAELVDDHEDEVALENESSTLEESSALEEPSAVEEPSTNEEEVPAALTTPDRRESYSSDRKTSLRTEALIQAAARAVMAKLETRERKSDVQSEHGETEVASVTTDAPEREETVLSPVQTGTMSARTSRRGSTDSTIHHNVSAPRSLVGDDGADSSSHPELDDDDVFSEDHSARSSMSGSTSGARSIEDISKSPAVTIRSRQSFGSRRSPRMSEVSMISGLSQYDDDDGDYPSTTRTTPRVPFRTPSNVRALQMSSPTPSVFAGSNPRSHKKHSQSGSSNFPTVSRLGSPNMTTQYSPKGRTPSRFKPREAPLVLLHVTLLPLRWPWADVVDGMDAVDLTATAKFEPSDDLRALRDAWRQVQDRVDDTVLERGILLPHPQNDFEVLEERLLEALDLPLRRRARILECGHYLGPTNVTAEDDMSQSESEDEYRPESRFSARSRQEKRHWCGTCKGEIRYEDLGPGKIFRVKVFASNGLMKAGAWDACWKEMERVDIEIEPIVKPEIQGELERLSALQVESAVTHEEEAEESVQEEPEQDISSQEDDRSQQDLVSSPPAMLHSESHQAMASRPQSALDRRQEYSTPQPVTSSPLPPSTYALHAPPQEPHSSALQAHSPYRSSPQSVRASLPSRFDQSVTSTPIDRSEARRRRDEERMREIYGEEAPPSSPPLQAPPSSHHYLPSPIPSLHPDPPVTSARASESFEPSTPSRTRAHYDIPVTSKAQSAEPADAHRPTGAHHAAENEIRRPYQSASLPELLLEVVKVLLRDPKNVAIAFLGVLAVFFMVRPAQGPANEIHDYVPNVESIVTAPQALVQELSSVVPSLQLTESTTSTESVTMAQSSVSTETVTVAQSIASTETVTVAQSAVVTETVTVASAPPAPPAPRVETERKVVRVVETVTETIEVQPVIETIYETETATLKITVSASSVSTLSTSEASVVSHSPSSAEEVLASSASPVPAESTVALPEMQVSEADIPEVVETHEVKVPETEEHADLGVPTEEVDMLNEVVEEPEQATEAPVHDEI